MTEPNGDYKMALYETITWEHCKVVKAQLDKALQGMTISNHLSNEELVVLLRVAKVHLDEAIRRLS
ncbi:hypothetical protein Cylst_2822 [Cylindrospermum stagnale PCC 7417]|uniref:Uncharacterized protein n=1 Tax=Cylindrospermum stagnale PCC 7417 TaxID=56107 RepID=K9WYY6_9NOST|nr:hypothetical protein [Cylindrospermum stagnale]AFZ25016.1 hypothetical protein Cylst_2822 [Cylindrospermum stagnale PCC 7417]